jgi:hypothetical protein
MKPNPVHRLPAPLEAAVQRLKLAARDAVERTIESLGLAALAASNAYQRDGLLGAQFELNRKSAVFVLTFNDAFDERMVRELSPRTVAGEPGATGLGGAPQPTEWASLSLVEDREVEALISAERFGLDMQHACEWELRELEGYVSALLGEAGGERNRSPLRPEIVGHAMIRGIEAVSERAENRKVLSGELTRSLAGLLRTAYTDILAELRDAGVQPMGLSVRNRGPRTVGGATSHHAELGEDSRQSSGADAFGRGYPDDRSLAAPPGYGGAGARDSRYDPRRAAASGFGGSAHSGLSSHYGARGPIGQVDPALMSLIRRLAFTDRGGDSGISPFGGGGGGGGGSGHLPANLIRAHREELRQASNGGLDHMVIDVIGFLFDQIMADPKVPPQLARQIARLQLPVLRAALGDPSFFSSRRHPVRRFVNRIASLGAAFEDFDEEGAKAFLAKVRSLVQEVVEGDFDQIETYEQQLAALEAFTNELAARESQDGGDAASLLSEKEDQQRLSQLYAHRLAGELKDLAAPPFLRDFLSGVWGQVLLRATEQHGADGAVTQRLRNAGRELFLSVQPKPTPALRKAFLADLPRLMQDLSDGMNLISWPEARRRAFFGQLMPAHAESLKTPGGRQLDINLMARQVDGALQRPPPSRADLKAMPATPALPVLTEEIILPQFSPEEARRVGLLQETAVDWNGKVDIDLGAEPADRPIAEVELGLPDLPGLPMLADAPDPTEGRALADHVQIGFAYHMNMDNHWHKVRLSHVSPARTFFIFTHGARHKKTVSLTQRMLQRLCETGRFKSFENGYLVERATARARRQLAALGGARPAAGGAPGPAGTGSATQSPARRPS